MAESTSCQIFPVDCIEGIPFIIRFKTAPLILRTRTRLSIEGIPFITRFKTPYHQP